AKIVGRQIVIRDVVGVKTAAERSHGFVARSFQPLPIGLHLFAGIDRRQRRRDPARFEATRWIRSRADLLYSELLAGIHNGVFHFVAVFPRTKEFPPRLSDHY